MQWGIENNICADVEKDRIALAESGLVTPLNFSLEDYVYGPLAYFAVNHNAIREHQRKGDQTGFPEFEENFRKMIDVRDKCRRALTLYWKEIIQLVLAEPNWDLMAKYEGVDRSFKLEQLQREIINPEWDSDLYLTKPGKLAVVTRNAGHELASSISVPKPNETRNIYLGKLGDFGNLSLPQISVYCKDASLFERIHKTTRDKSIRVLDWAVPSILWEK